MRGQDPEPTVGVKYHPPAHSITDEDLKTIKTKTQSRPWTQEEIKMITKKLRDPAYKHTPKREFNNELAQKLQRNHDSIRRIKSLILQKLKTQEP